MTLSTEECLAAITLHSQGLAEAARDNLGVHVEHCPGWTVADLVWHVADVHWFWRTIAGERLSEPPDESRRPPRPPDAELVEHFLGGAASLVSTLRESDQSAACWTWATQKDVAFVTRHQVQEAAVHHWDAAHAVGQVTMYDFIAADVAADAVDEFLTFSVSTDDDPADRPALHGSLWFCGCVSMSEVAHQWMVKDGRAPGTLAFAHEGPWDESPEMRSAGGHCSPGDLLLWFYGRTPSLMSDLPREDDRVVRRFRKLCFTD